MKDLDEVFASMFDSKHAFGVGKPWNRPLQSSSSSSTTIELQLLEKDVVETPLDDGLSPRSYRPLHANKPPFKSRILPFIGPSGGWKSGALYIAFWTSSVFLTNLIVTIWGSRRSIGGGVLFEGDCGKVNKLDTGLHILINSLSTILLSGSNYCMQCLSAPTRREVDEAHAKGTWLHIGIPSLRNMWYINKRRAFLWCLLGLTSLPLHLFYNSAVFSSISSNSYYVFSVSQSFIDDAECTNCTIGASYQSLNSPRLWNPTDYPSSSESTLHGFANLLDVQHNLSRNVSDVLGYLHQNAHLGQLERLEPAECIKQYSRLLQSTRRNVLLVASDVHFPPRENNTFRRGSHVYWADYFLADDVGGADTTNTYSWICSGIDMPSTTCENGVSQVERNPENWRVGWNNSQALPVEYCLSETAIPHCKVQFDTTIAVLVTVLNFVKASLVIYIAFYLQHDPLVTMGDAVASFLSKKDPTTENMCLFSQRDFRKKTSEIKPREWDERKFKWKDATSRAHRATTIILIVIALLVVIYLLNLGVVSLRNSGTSSNASSLARLGYGTIDPRTSLTGLSDSIFTAAFIANSPQVILSLLYFSYNSVLTAMLLGHEWTTYAQKRKGLRVSFDARGEQRSTYFLQLPYRFGAPLLLLSGLLHWFVSQSIFVVAIEFYDAFGSSSIDAFDPSTSDLKTCGYSPIAIISVVILGGVMLLVIIAVGFIPYKGGIPLAGSCSMAMSAACHSASKEERSQRDSDSDSEEGATALQKVQWGAMSTSLVDIGHCGFSAEDVSAPAKGTVYAGLA